MTDKRADNSQPNTEDLGLSNRALSLARMIDRLDYGEYKISLSRPVFSSSPWRVEIARNGKRVLQKVIGADGNVISG